MFIVGIAEKHLTPSVVQVDVANEIQSFSTYYNNSFFTILKEQLCKNFVSTDNLDELLNTNIKNVISNEAFSEKQNIKKETFQYVPILPLLKKLIKKRRNGFICNNHNVFKNDKYALRLYFYIDEFEVCNPIGAHCTVHKICAFYFYLGNIEEKYVSRLQNIYLCILVKENLIKKHKTYEEILKPLIQDLITLKNDGVSVIVDGQPIQLFGGLATISADNLSSHAIAGFRRVFNSGLFCRQCMTSYSNKNKVFSKFDTTIRTHEMYLYHLEAILGPGKISLSMYGVERRCPFLDLPYFNISQSFPPDIMHDMMEGTIPQLISLLILKLKEEKVISIQQINIELNIFKIGRNDRMNKPVPFVERSTSSINFISSASQKYCEAERKSVNKIFRLLPFMIGKVSESNTYWLLYLQLREIADYIFAPKISEAVLPYVQFLVEHFLQNFVEYFPNNFTPKFHLTLHYTRLINDYGPLRYLWCMCFEAKHLYFKKLASTIRNFKNIAYSLAKRHQLRQCWEIASLEYFHESEKTYSLCSITFDSLAVCIQEKRLTNFGYIVTDNKETVWKCSTFVSNGIQYHVNDTVILALVHAEEIPLFFKIYHIKRFQHHWVFFGKLLVCDKYSEHLHAFRVKEEDALTLCFP
ncbi:uncharacterized protein LOC136082740 [Hydra vulgaris]|uniref:Uncharacterized protein LOC136082740 n=1 Tax=Hydra vulgaris TaxID=6087 RepID=A0ABM4C9B6_HYDVU